MSRPSTPSQTVGPYLAIGLTWPEGSLVVPDGTPGAVWVRGRLLDGDGQPVPDGMVETWQVEPAGFGRSLTGPDGSYAIRTVKPGRVDDGRDGLQAPHLDVSVFARGLLARVVTRVYFDDEVEANAADDVLASIPAARRGSLIARASGDGYVHDIVLQGPDETVFFTL